MNSINILSLAVPLNSSILSQMQSEYSSASCYIIIFFGLQKERFSLKNYRSYDDKLDHDAAESKRGVVKKKSFTLPPLLQGQ